MATSSSGSHRARRALLSAICVGLVAGGCANTPASHGDAARHPEASSAPAPRDIQVALGAARDVVTTGRPVVGLAMFGHWLTWGTTPPAVAATASAAPAPSGPITPSALDV